MSLFNKVKVIRDYFGPWENSRDLMVQLKALSPEEKLELAVGAAKNMGLTQDQVDFPLT